jgi:hypothetical protein
LRSWKELPSVFSDARAAGFNVGLAGWWLPYCDVFPSVISACGVPKESDLRPSSVYASMEHQLHDHVDLHWFRTRLGWENHWTMRQDLYHSYEAVHRHAMNMVADPGLGLVLIHWPIPHPLGIYDRNTDQFAFSHQNNYLDNYELVDRVLGEMRSALERAGLGERTAILLSSDHPLRPDEWNIHATWTHEESALSQETLFPWVPFLLKLPGQTDPVVYEAEFNTLLTKDLVLDILTGKTVTPADAAAWINARP